MDNETPIFDEKKLNLLNKIFTSLSSFENMTKSGVDLDYFNKNVIEKFYEKNKIFHN
jgi:hypothetical protein